MKKASGLGTDIAAYCGVALSFFAVADITLFPPSESLALVLAFCIPVAAVNWFCLHTLAKERRPIRVPADVVTVSRRLHTMLRVLFFIWFAGMLACMYTEPEWASKLFCFLLVMTPLLFKFDSVQSAFLTRLTVNE